MINEFHSQRAVSRYILLKNICQVYQINFFCKFPKPAEYELSKMKTDWRIKDKGERRKKPRFLNLAFYFSALVITVHESFFRIESKSSKHNDTIHGVQEKNKKRERVMQGN